ncbi:DUF1146 domain-containing protein [Texcoconibacillus texcoconensis]|uniref:Putative integral membrane protein (TIGR02327 family) n=1 Tax=Texcoconibacillus texcoconensis TaxID=1095777 RepID=A0A840QRF9_9BACI|nr:DUF1146 family protein [Texcoconibacillus texcoconensis]MBB5174056.1 putative integral membrane protein (TIGR02327 family) [Texcoconibacillus texcoconensis]
MLQDLGQDAIFNISVTLAVLILVWWAIQSFKFDLFVKDPEGPKAKLLMILVTLALTHLVSQFVLNYFNWSLMLRHLL